ncbi:hypothetical protein PROFUN_11408 [Planoprotostelium fungivorum]|uniref:Uncharacterized protein n=1 Tax=Planoprotostelium fungivorum TaxID=1890364 RepID=A0A2P6NA82_9EUKA|nr:hypothetical protein PROFUN_11408 [Planoprotostelium fungivorum]
MKMNQNTNREARRSWTCCAREVLAAFKRCSFLGQDSVVYFNCNISWCNNLLTVIKNYC